MLPCTRKLRSHQRDKTKVGNRLEGDCHIMVSVDKQIFRTSNVFATLKRKLQGYDRRIKK